MARIRSIKPEFWDSEDTATLPVWAALTYPGLWNLADDEGRGRFQPTIVHSRLHGSRPGSSLKTTREALKTLIDRFIIVVYKSPDGIDLYQIVNFKKHQHPNRPMPSRLPAPPASLIEEARKKQCARSEDALPVVEGDRSSSRIGDGGGGGEEPAVGVRPHPPVIASQGDGDAEEGLEQGPEAPPTLLGEPVETGPEQAIEPPKTDLELTLEAFQGFLTPSYAAKLSSILDLKRQGVSHERMRRAAIEHGDWDFYAVVKTLRNGGGKGDRGGPPPPRKDPTPSPSRAEGQKLLDDARAAVDAKLAELPADQIAEWTRQAEQESLKLPESMRKLSVISALRRRAGTEFGIKGV